MEYKQEQLTSIQRSINNIEVTKIVGIQDNHLELKRRDGKTFLFHVYYPERYKIGERLDAIFYNDGTGRIVGNTPPEFYMDEPSVASKLAVESARRSDTRIDTSILDNYR